MHNEKTQLEKDFAIQLQKCIEFFGRLQLEARLTAVQREEIITRAEYARDALTKGGLPSQKAGAQTQDEERQSQLFISEADEIQRGEMRRRQDRANAQRYGHFPELTIEQNRVIWEAREKGWDVFYPVESPMVQADKTYWGAIEFLKGAK